MSPRIGGANAITWPSFWVIIVVSAVMNLPDRYTDHSSGAVLFNLIASTIAVMAMFAVMLALSALFLRGAGQRPRPVRALAIFAAGAATRGLVLGLLLAWMGTGEPRLGFRVISSILTLTLVMAITATVVDLARTAAARRRELRVEAERLRAAEDEALAKAEAIQEQATAQVRGLLLERLAALQGGRAHDLAPSLRADAEEVIRPMSHEMVALPRPAQRDDTEVAAGRIVWADIWRTASLGRPFRAVGTAVVAMIASVTSLVGYNESASRGLAYVVVEGVLVFTALTAFDRLLTPRLRRMGPTGRTLAVVLGAMAAMAIAAVLLALIMQATGSLAPWRTPAAIMVIGPFVVLALAVDQGFRQQVVTADAELVARNARLKHAAASAGAAAWHEERRLSRALHGPVQTAVRAAAMRIEHGDTTGAEEMLVQALGHLEMEGPQGGVADALAGVARAWDGLCAIDVEMPVDVAANIDRDPPLASAVVDICTDACSNAVRHGGARSVAVYAHDVGDAVELTVTDDGAPGGLPAAGGLGSTMLDDVSVSWHRRREGSSTVLRATLPLSRPSPSAA